MRYQKWRRPRQTEQSVRFVWGAEERSNELSTRANHLRPFRSQRTLGSRKCHLGLSLGPIKISVESSENSTLNESCFLTKYIDAAFLKIGRIASAALQTLTVRCGSVHSINGDCPRIAGLSRLSTRGINTPVTASGIVRQIVFRCRPP